MGADHPKIDLIVKLLGKSTSDNDNEAIAALRAAHRFLKAEGWTWEQLLRGRITIVADPFASGVGASRPPTTTHHAPPPPPRPRAPAAKPPPSPPPRHSPPPSPPPPPPTIASVPNRFASMCYCCGSYVGIAKGFIFRRQAVWKIACDPCATQLNNGMNIPVRAAKPKTMNVNDIFNSI